MKIVLFADFASSNHGLNQAQYMLKQLCNEGHQITLFGKSNFTLAFLLELLFNLIFDFRGKNPSGKKLWQRWRLSKILDKQFSLL